MSPLKALFARCTPPVATVFAILAAVAAVTVGISACGADNVAGGTAGAECEVHTDCNFGLVCGAGNECVEAECEFCEDDDELICHDNLCTAPECSGDADCDDAQCIDGVCGDSTSSGGCQSDNDGPTGESCHPFTNECQPDDNGGGSDDCTTDNDCSGDQSCEAGNCVDDSDNNGNNGGECELDASDCDGATPYLDDVACECVECDGDTDCATGEQCVSGSCQSGDVDGCLSGQECDPQQSGSCSNAGEPYCIDECCVECIGAGDCDGNEICSEDGFCETADGCSSDADCPSGFDCDDGECVAPDTGESCQDDTDCPSGQFCNPDTEECEGLGGGAGCGLCNPDCTCDGDLTCESFVCTGCETEITVDPFEVTDTCPDDQTCTDWIGIDVCI